VSPDKITAWAVGTIVATILAAILISLSAAGAMWVTAEVFPALGWIDWVGIELAVLISYVMVEQITDTWDSIRELRKKNEDVAGTRT